MTHAFATMPDEPSLRAANVNPATGLATDYLNVFNEYIMLAEMMDEGVVEPRELSEWQPVDYESHFVQTGFTGMATVLAAYRALPEVAREAFEDAVNTLIDSILAHQADPVRGAGLLPDIRDARDRVSALISGEQAVAPDHGADMQSVIDALFD